MSLMMMMMMMTMMVIFIPEKTLTIMQVYMEATACFPFIVANTFAKDI